MNKRNNPALNLALQLHQAEQQLYYCLNKTVRNIANISYSQFMVLQAVGELGHASQAELAAFIHQSPSSMTPHIKALQNKALVREEHSYSHQRTHVVYLTPGAERQLPYISAHLEESVGPLLIPFAKYPGSYTGITVEFRRLAHNLQRSEV